MNPQPYQRPPRWWPPKLSPFWVRVFRPLRKRVLSKDQRIMEVQVRGLEHLRKAIGDGCGIVIVPNHSGHSDPPILYEAAEQARMPFYFMAAWQVFARENRLRQWLFQVHGCFSVDREGSDRQALRQAMEIVQEAPNPLVIFAEGEVYHVNDRVTPFQDGPAVIALSAQKRTSRPIVCIPCGIKYFYMQDPTPELMDLMDRLERQILWRPRPDPPLKERIYRYAEALLGIKELEYLGAVQSLPLTQRVGHLAESIMWKLEDRYGLKPEDQILPLRVKMCRREVIKCFEGEDEKAKEQARIDLEDLFAVIQLFSYPGDYVAGNPTIERLAETLDKFEEDIFRVPTATIRGTRKVIASFGEPIPVASPSDKKTSVHRLTQMLEDGVQCLLDEINRSCEK
jgi:1-acyl-sn-glycerol-3-phosphate acyltransferase